MLSVPRHHKRKSSHPIYFAALGPDELAWEVESTWSVRLTLQVVLSWTGITYQLWVEQRPPILHLNRMVSCRSLVVRAVVISEEDKVLLRDLNYPRNFLMSEYCLVVVAVRSELFFTIGLGGRLFIGE